MDDANPIKVLQSNPDSISCYFRSLVEYVDFLYVAIMNHLKFDSTNILKLKDSCYLCLITGMIHSNNKQIHNLQLEAIKIKDIESMKRCEKITEPNPRGIDLYFDKRNNTKIVVIQRFDTNESGESNRFKIQKTE